MYQGEPQYDPRPDEGSTSIFDRVNNYILLFYAFACFLMYWSLAGLMVAYGLNILSLSVPGAVAFIFPMYLLSRRFRAGFFEEYRLATPRPFLLLLTLLVSAGAILPIEVISHYCEKIWPPADDYISFVLSIKPKGPLSFAAVLAGVVIVAPVGEELLFRGFIQRILQRNMRGAYSVLLAGIVFGLCHFELYIILPIALLGALFGFVFLKTGNLAYPVMGHALYNLVAFIRLHTLSEDALRAGEATGFSPFWLTVSVVAATLGIYAFARVTVRT